MKAIFKRHVASILATLLFQSFYYYGFIYTLSHLYQFDEETMMLEVYGDNPPIYYSTLQIIFMLQGWFWPLIRLNEPLNFKILKEETAKVFKCCLKGAE